MPVIKQGSKLRYEIVTSNGVMPLTIRLDSLASDFVKLGWMMENQSSGSWIMKKQSIESAIGGYWNQLEPDMAVELQGTQSTVFLSKGLWDALQKDKKILFDTKTYQLKSPSEKQQFKLGDKLVDALFMETEDASSRIWVLNNPVYRVMLKIEGNSAGVDAELKSID